MANQGDRIHNAIYTAASTWDFPLLDWDKDTGLRTTSDSETERPSTLLIRELTSEFAQAIGQRRTPRLRERVDWQWEALLKFDHQVSLEEFEEFYSNTPLFLTRTAELDQQVVIQLGSVAYEHPPEQQSSSGTRAILTFTASLSRK